MMKKKVNFNFSKTLSWIKTHKVKTILLVVLIAFAGGFAYNKYLDYRNVEDMKQLLADFEQLERDVEAETGEELTIEASCGSVGKFATSYACSISLVTPDGTWKDGYKKIISNKETGNMKEFGECRMLSERSIGFETDDDYYYCSFYVNGWNENEAESIFYKYDVSPGSPF